MAQPYTPRAPDARSSSGAVELWVGDDRQPEAASPLSSFRKQHPEYDDMGDVELADALHAKFYADVPKKDFDAKLGLKTSQGQGFMKGMARVTENLTPDWAPVWSPVGIARHGADEINKWVQGQEKTGTRSGRGGEIAGEFVSSAPTLALGGPITSGAIQGYATSESNTPLGKVKDAALGAVGSKVGAMVVGKAANVLAPVLEPAVGRLAQRGIKMTPGQIRGGKAMVREDKLMSRPNVGDAIGAGRRESIMGFNRATIDEALKPLGVKLPANVETGHDAVAFAQDAVSKAYNKVVPHLRVAPDKEFVQGIRDLAPSIQALGDNGKSQVQGILSTIKFDQAGQLAGRKMQDAMSEMRRLATSYGTSSVAGERELGRVLGDVHEELTSMMVRQNPQQAKALKAANGAFRGQAIVDDAASRADEGVFATGQLKQAVRRADQSRRKNASAAGTAFMQDFSRDARKVLPAKVPDSGTAGRLQQGNMLANIKGGADRIGYEVDNALMGAFAKAPPKLQAQVRNLLLSGRRPAAAVGALGGSHTPGD